MRRVAHKKPQMGGIQNAGQDVLPAATQQRQADGVVRGIREIRQ